MKKMQGWYLVKMNDIERHPTICSCTRHTRTLLVSRLKNNHQQKASPHRAHGYRAPILHKYLQIPLNPARIAHLQSLIRMVLEYGLERVEVRDNDVVWTNKCVILPENVIYPVGRFATLLHTPPVTDSREEQTADFDLFARKATKIVINRYTMRWFYLNDDGVEITTHPIGHSFFTSKTWSQTNDDCDE